MPNLYILEMGLGRTQNPRDIREKDRMKAFGYVLAEDLEHAIALLGEHGARAKILAGGTDLLVELKHAVHNPEIIVDVSRLRELKDIAVADDGLHIGALVTHSDIMNSPVIRAMFPALVAAAHSIGATQTRNLGTLGGNLVTCVPSMDSGPALIALDVSVTVANAEGQRRMPLAELFVGPRKTSLKPGDLLVDIVIPKENLGKPTAFEKFGLRKGQALALVNVGASFWVGDNSVFVAPRIALGAVAPTVIRAPKAEAFLDGCKISAEVMAEAGRIAAMEAKPISDFRASADYRRDLVAVLVKRALANAQALATAKEKEIVA
jgi:carbon-monoxide dehydrogenase medium subunit